MDEIVVDVLKDMCEKNKEPLEIEDTGTLNEFSSKAEHMSDAKAPLILWESVFF